MRILQALAWAAVVLLFAAVESVAYGAPLVWRCSSATATTVGSCPFVGGWSVITPAELTPATMVIHCAGRPPGMGDTDSCAGWAPFGSLADSAPIGVCIGGTNLANCDGANEAIALKSTLTGAAPPPPPPPPPAGVNLDWVVTWTTPTKNDDGSTLTDLQGYRIQRAPASSGPWATEVSVGLINSATILAPAGAWCFRVIALASSAESGPSASACASKSATGSVPEPPVIVGSQPRAFALVSGATTGLRAVYERTATGSRGAKIGDLVVGPGSGDFQRVECSTADAFTFGGVRYGRVTDAAAPSNLRTGYVSGCYDVGTH